MKTQIAFPVSQELKKEFNQKLEAKWLTAKAFFHFCMAAFINEEITINIQHNTPKH